MVTNMNNKKLLMVSLLILLVVVLGFIFFNSNDVNMNNINSDKKVVYNNSKKFKKTKTVKNVTFSDISCSFDGTNSILKYVISNKTNKKIHIGKYEALIKDENKVLLSRILIDFNRDLKPLESENERDLVVGVDLSKAEYFDIIFKDR